MAAPWQVTGTTDIAPHSPVADWRCVPEGEGYGNYYDPISQQYATVTRTTPKTARTADGRIVDVPAGKLALEPWSLHKEGGIGHAAIIEETRTNYLLNSYGSIAGPGGRWLHWEDASGVGSTFSTLPSGLYGNALRVTTIGISGNQHISSNSAVGLFAPGDTAVFSAYVKDVASDPDCKVYPRVIACSAAGVVLGYTTAVYTSPIPASWTRISQVYTNLPADTSYVQCTVLTVVANQQLDYMFAACQLEKGSFATSYIPTTTAAVTRAADVVAVPTTGWNAAAGTWVTVVGPSPGNANTRGIFSWYGSSSNRMRMYYGTGAYALAGMSIGGGDTNYDTKAFSGAAIVGAMVCNAGNAVRVYVDGSPGTRTDAHVTPTGLPATAEIGQLESSAYLGTSIQRVTVYAEALTDEQLAAADMTTDLLAGIEGVAAPALAADWRVVPTGLGYGNYYDSVTRQWATVTRTTPKTAQIAPDRIVDVPAGQLAAVPWSLHKAGGTGYAAVIEEERTNYLLNSYFAADSNGDGLADSWDGVSALTLESSAVYGDKAQRLVAADSGYAYFRQATAVGSFAAGDTVTASAFGKSTGSTGRGITVIAYNSAGSLLGFVSSTGVFGPTSSHVSVTYGPLPTNTSYVRVYFGKLNALTTGDTIDLTIDVCQLEKGSFATSYIPTTTAAATRNADVVTVPTTGWSAVAGTMVAVAGRYAARTTVDYPYLFGMGSGTFPLRMFMDTASTGLLGGSACGGTDTSTVQAGKTGPFVGALAYTQNATIKTFVSGVGTGTPEVTTTMTLSPTCYIGSREFSVLDRTYNGPIARVTVYASALTDAQIQSAELTTELLKGLSEPIVTSEVVL